MKNQYLDFLAKKLAVPSIWLDKLIQFESAWNPKAVNKYNGASGLIQFTNTTAKGLGFNSAKEIIEKYPDIDSQLLGPVYQYLIKYLPFPNPQSLYMSVFYPVARNWGTTQVFPLYITKGNPGIYTVQDYIKKVENKNQPVYLLIGILSIGILLILTKRKHVYE